MARGVVVQGKCFWAGMALLVGGFKGAYLREGRGGKREKGRATGAFQQIKFYDYTPGYGHVTSEMICCWAEQLELCN